MFVIYVFIAIVLVAIVAYVVYIRCRPSVEPFTNIINYTLTPTDILHKGIDAVSVDKQQEKQNVTPKQRIKEADIRNKEFQISRDAIVKYGVVETDQDGYQYSSKLLDNNNTNSMYHSKLDNTSIEEFKLPMYAIQFMWSNTESHSDSPDVSVINNCTLSITLFIMYSVGTMNHMTIESFDVNNLTVDKTYKSFIPIDNDIIHRKIAQTAKVVRICIERTDTNNSILGVEKVSIVKYKPDKYIGKLKDKEEIDIYNVFAGKKKVNQNLENKKSLGTRISMGVMLCDPVCLVSINYTPTDTSPILRFGITSSIVADILYGNQEPVYGNSGTQCFTMYVAFASPLSENIKKKVSLYIGNIQSSQQEQFKAYCNDHTQISLLKDRNQSTDSNTNLLAQNVTKATFFNVQPSVVYSFTIALTEQLYLDDNSKFSFNVVASDQDVHIQSISYVPYNGNSKQSEPKLLIKDTVLTTKDIAFNSINNNSKSMMLHSNVLTVFDDHIVDADATIFRFNNYPGEDAQQMSECGIFSVNDGFVFSGSLLLPLHTGTAHANNLCTLSLQFEKYRLVIKLTQDGAYLYLYDAIDNRTSLIKTVSHNLVANDVSWYIYIYKDTVGVCINDTLSFSNHDKLKTKYNKNSTYFADSYPVLTNVKLTVDPAITLESRLITAIRKKPTARAMKSPRSDIVHLRYTKPSLLYKNSFSTTLDDIIDSKNAIISYNLEHPRSTLQKDSGFSMQFEINQESIYSSMILLKKHFYNTSIHSSSEEAVLWQSNTIKIVLVRQKQAPLHLYDISVYFTSESGQCETTPRVIGSYKMLEPTSHKNYPTVLIKYSNYKRAERVCIVHYKKDYKEGRLLSSIEHTLAKKIKPEFNLIMFHQYAIVNLVCGYRILSTNCNPYNNSRMCDCAGRFNGNPHKNIRNNIPSSTVSEIVDSKADNTVIVNPSKVIPFTSTEDCKQYAMDQFGSNAIFATYFDSNTHEEYCTIAYAHHQRATIKSSTDDNIQDSKTYIATAAVIDEGMRLLKSLL